MRPTGERSPASSTKGESLHALRMDLCYTHEGAVRHRHHEDRAAQALRLTIVANAIVAWTRSTSAWPWQTACFRAPVDEELLALISPSHNENVGFYGTFSFDVDRELAALANGYRPLRQGRR